MSRPSPSNNTVALDARMARHSGIGTYVRHLAHGLCRSKTDLSFRFYAPRPILEDLPLEESGSGHIFRPPIYGVQEQWGYMRLPAKWDIWHSPHYNIPVRKRGKLVVTVHDLTHLVLAGKVFNRAKEAYARFLFGRVRAHADALIAVSHHTKKDLVERIGIHPDRIWVIHEGVDPAFVPLREQSRRWALRQRYNLPDSFLLYVGNLKPHKNVGQLVRVFERLRGSHGVPKDLVLVGKPDPAILKQDADLRRAHGSGCVHFLREVPFEDLPGLYGMARAMVLPSLYEGFGLVVLEAMACGIPVICSNRASLPEIAGDAAELFDPNQDVALEKSLINVLASESYEKSLARRGFARAKEFTWDRMVERTLQVYRHVLTGRAQGAQA